MTNRKTTKKYLFLFAIFILPALFLVFFATGNHVFKGLPYYGPGDENTPYTVAAFELTNPSGEKVTSAAVEGKIYVADFYYETCETFCPDMIYYLNHIQWMIRDPSFDDVMVFSHVVNGTKGLTQTQQECTELLQIAPGKWAVFAGTQEEVFDIAVNNYQINHGEKGLEEGRIPDYNKCVLVDKKGNIRGIYDKTDVEEIERIIDEIKILKKEEDIQLKEEKLRADAN